MSSKVTYTKLEKTLNTLGSQLSPGEAHGILTGMASMSANQETNSFKNSLLQELDLRSPTKQQWSVLRNSLVKTEFGYNPLLPNDNAKLELRLSELGCWCRGYLCGLGMLGITSEDLQGEGIKELVDDLSQIAHVDIETTANEEDEKNYTELVEYVSVAVQNIQLELQQARSSSLH